MKPAKGLPLEIGIDISNGPTNTQRGFMDADCFLCGGSGYVIVYFDDINSYGKDCSACGGTGAAA